MGVIVTGPAYIFVGTAGRDGDGGDMEFLGTCERAPDIRVVPGYSPCKADIRGHKIPVGFYDEGEEAYLGFQLTYWTAEGFAKARSQSGTGLMSKGRIGKILVLNDSLTVAIVFNYGEPGDGYRFFGAVLDDWKILDASTSAAKLSVIFHAIGTVQDDINNAFVLYDDDVQGLQPPAI